jgi:N-acyl-D-amino-acid deacylase
MAMAEFDLLIAGGTVVDGTGSARRRADVAIRGGMIAAVGELDDGHDVGTRVDASGRIVCPGFIDAHSHSDLSVLSDPHARSKVHQGVTTEIVGNCGLAVAPLAKREANKSVREAIYIVDPDPSVAWSWRTVDDYFSVVEAVRPALNVAVLAGHLAIRASVMGYDNRPASDTEMQRMREMLDEALQQGAIGLSTGLMYAPIAFAPTAELVSLGDIVANADRVFAMHMRNYGDRLLDAVDEAIEVGERSGCRVQASHLAVTGQRNWGKVGQALERFDRARARSVRIKHDCYPYLAGSANLSQLLPGRAHEGGTAAMVERLRTPSERERIREEWKTTFALTWEDILVCWVRPGGDASVVGKRVSEIAVERGQPPDSVALDLIADEEGLINMIAFGRSEADLRDALTHPDTMIGSDGLAVDPCGPSGSGHPHPRYYGCYPRLLETYVRQEQVLSLEDAIYKSTGLVAATFGLRDRGVLADGKAADVVVFDAARIADNATFLEPQQFPTGIDLVVVNGEVVVREGTHTGTRAGKVLRA